MLPETRWNTIPGPSSAHVRVSRRPFGTSPAHSPGLTRSDAARAKTDFRRDRVTIDRAGNLRGERRSGVSASCTMALVRGGGARAESESTAWHRAPICPSITPPPRCAWSDSRRSAIPATPCLSYARSKRPGPSTRITWIIGKTEHSLLRGLHGVEFIVLDKALGWRGYLEVRRALGRRRFDALLHMHASARANLVSVLVHAPIRIGFDRARARDQQWLFTNRRLPARARRHVMDGLFEFADALGVSLRRAALGHPGRRPTTSRSPSAHSRKRIADARDQPVHGPALPQLPQLARGLVRRDRRLCGDALRRPGAC